jgi:hypothetical protein
MATGKRFHAVENCMSACRRRMPVASSAERTASCGEPEPGEGVAEGL